MYDANRDFTRVKKWRNKSSVKSAPKITVPAWTAKMSWLPTLRKQVWQAAPLKCLANPQVQERDKSTLVYKIHEQIRTRILGRLYSVNCNFARSWS